METNSEHNLVAAVEPATIKRLQTISENLGLEIDDNDWPDYQEFVNKSLEAFDALDDFPPQSLPVKYPRIPGCRPAAEDNKYNAWACKMELKGTSSGLLSGKTIAIKDNIAIAGSPLNNGSKIWCGYVPEYDATVVTRILDAGGIIAGKSVCENQCFSGSSFTSAEGPVRNPHDLSRSAGGSSSGSAVLVAAGEVDMAIGGDQGGSIRLPSCWCGIVGLKPTHGLVPCTGAMGMEPSFDHVGPMARNVKDVALLLEAIAGYDDGRDHRQGPDVRSHPYASMLDGDLRDKRFAVIKEGFLQATANVQLCINQVLDALRSAGATVEEISIPEHLKGGALFTALLPAFYHSMVECNGQPLGFSGFYSGSAMKFMDDAYKTHSQDCSPIMKGVMLLGEFTKQAAGYHLCAKAMNLRTWLRKAYDLHLDKYNALIMPTIPFVADKLPHPGIAVKDWFSYGLRMVVNTSQFNLTGHPALSLNVGVVAPEDGHGGPSMPVGLQLVGKHFGEASLLNLAYGLEQLLLSD